MGGGASTPERDVFGIYGPSHLISVNWTDSYHRTSVASSLLKGVSILETDKQKKRVGRNAQANHWWEFFNFSLIELLMDESDTSIYGAVFEYNYENTSQLGMPPRYVIAFSEMPKSNFGHDVELDTGCIYNDLQNDPRFEKAILEVVKIVSKHGHEAVWLVGHSLGACLALLAGKTMACSGYILETYLFHPPISSIPQEQEEVDSNRLQDWFARIVEKTLDWFSFEDKEYESSNPSWVPYIYLNQDDIVGSPSISEIEGPRNSHYRSLLGKSSLIHLLVSADLTVNMNKVTDFKTAYGLHPDSVRRIGQENRRLGFKNICSGFWAKLVFWGHTIFLLCTKMVQLFLFVIGYLSPMDRSCLQQWWERDSVLRNNWKSYCIRPTIKKNDVFIISGPSHLTAIDWNNSYHRASVASSLVRGVSMLERDAQKKRLGPEAQANHWWEFFNFSLLEPLIESDGSIYGAVFEYKEYENTPHLGMPPRYVIAFRGTNLNPQTRINDVLLDLRIFFNNLHNGPRFKHIIQVINRYVTIHGKEAVWLAGHSLGAGLALLAGKTMAMFGCTLQVYIFNPPISSFPLILLKNEDLKLLFRIACNFIKATIVDVIGQDVSEEREAFKKLAPWKPLLFVNPSDPISSEYIDHFKNRLEMSLMEDEDFKFPSRFTVKDWSTLTLSAESLHLLPSAYLITNISKGKDWLQAHSINQWWDPTSKLQSQLYEFNS